MECIYVERKNDRLPIFTESFRELQGERSNTEFAAFLGISRQTVGFYFNGDRVPDALTLVKISQRCGVSADWLLGLSNFVNHEQKQYANDLSDKILDLMESEFDEGDRRRVSTALKAVIEGFKASMCDYGCYTNYENVVMRVMLALHKTSDCVNMAHKFSEAEISENISDTLCEKLHKVISDAASTAYEEMGYFFRREKENITTVLNSTFFRAVDLKFSYDLNKLEEMMLGADVETKE